MVASLGDKEDGRGAWAIRNPRRAVARYLRQTLTCLLFKTILPPRYTPPQSTCNTDDDDEEDDDDDIVILL